MAVEVETDPPRSSLTLRNWRATKLRQKERRLLNKDDELECHAATRGAGIARNPKMGKPRPSVLWKDRVGERANRKFNSGTDAEVRHTNRRTQVDAIAGERRRRRSELMKGGSRFGAGIAACADLDDENTIWGDDDIAITHDTATQDAISASA